jgi:hypothetical protein
MVVMCVCAPQESFKGTGFVLGSLMTGVLATFVDAKKVRKLGPLLRCSAEPSVSLM